MIKVTTRTTKLRLKLLEHKRLTGMPQYKVAAAAGMPPSRVTEYALGQKKMPIRHVIALSKVLQCNPDEIVGDAPSITTITNITTIT